MQWNDETFTLDTPGGTLVFNQATGDTYYNDPTQCSGLDQAPIRANIDQMPHHTGGILHPFYYDARHITVSGLLLNRTGTLAARQTLEDDLIDALDSILNADGTLSWASAARSLTVRCDIGVTFSGAFEKTYVFGLVAADPGY